MSKLTVDTKKLATELAYISKRILNNPTNPYWINVLIEAEGSTLRLTGTDGMNAVSTFITLESPVKEPFVAAIAAKKFNDIVKLLEQDKVNLSKTDARVTLTAGKGKYVFGLSPDAITSIKQFQNLAPEGDDYIVNAKKVAELVKTASLFSADEETTKYTLMGVKLTATEDLLMVTAMDGQRAVDIMVDDKAEGRNFSLFIPREGAVLLPELVDGDEVRFSVSKSAIRIECGNRVAIIRRAAAENLPDIAAFLNKYLEKQEVTIVVESHLLTSAVKRLMTAVDGKLRKIVFKTTEAGLTLTSQDPMGACQEFTEELVGTIEGTGQFNLNASYVLDFTKLVSGLVTLRYNPSFPNAAVIFTNGSGFRCMISAMK